MPVNNPSVKFEEVTGFIGLELMDAFGYRNKFWSYQQRDNI